MLQSRRQWGGSAAIGALVTGLLAACGGAPAGHPASPAGHPASPAGHPASPAYTSAAAAAVVGSTRPYQLYTHCGITEARIGHRYFEAVHPLSDGQGNPPPGWGNPYQKGTMTVLSPTEAVFRDEAGHQVRFRLRPGATAFRLLCS